MFFRVLLKPKWPLSAANFWETSQNSVASLFLQDIGGALSPSKIQCFGVEGAFWTHKFNLPIIGFLNYCQGRNIRLYVCWISNKEGVKFPLPFQLIVVNFSLNVSFIWTKLSGRVKYIKKIGYKEVDRSFAPFVMYYNVTIINAYANDVNFLVHSKDKLFQERDITI